MGIGAGDVAEGIGAGAGFDWIGAVEVATGARDNVGIEVGDSIGFDFFAKIIIIRITLSMIVMIINGELI